MCVRYEVLQDNSNKLCKDCDGGDEAASSP